MSPAGPAITGSQKQALLTNGPSLEPIGCALVYWFEREFFGSPGRTRTYKPWVNSVRALLLKMRDLSPVSGEKTQSPATRNLVGPRVPASVNHPGPQCMRIPRGNPSRRRKAMGSDRLQLFLRTKRYSYLA